MKKLLVLVLALLLCAAGVSLATAEGLQKDVLVLFTSDVHCGVDQNFTYAGLKAIKDAAADAGSHVLLVDNGDSVQGESLGLMSKGMANIGLMNDVGYDIAIPGNHEYDYGMDQFFRLVETAEFPYISCNFRKNGELVFDPYIIKEFDGVKIAFVGATTPETLITSTPRYFQDENGNYIYDFTEGGDGSGFYAAVQTAADHARADGADYVILMAHLGRDAAAKPYTYADVIEHTNGIDAVLDGHSHDTEKVVMKNKDGKAVVRQACGTKLQSIGWMRISAKDGSLDTGLYNWNNEMSAPELLGIRNKMSIPLFYQTEQVAIALAIPVGQTAVDLTANDPAVRDETGTPIRIIRRAETNLGDLCADAFRIKTGADIGIVNGGGFRKGIRAGQITLKEIMDVFPFGNTIITVEATGQQILNALEWGVRTVPEENGAFLQVSGLTYEIHTYIESSCVKDENGLFAGVTGEYRVKNVMVGGEPLDLEKTYKVTGLSYPLVDHGDGQTAFDGVKILQEHEQVDYEMLASYIVKELDGAVGEEYANPYGLERITAVEEAPAGAEKEPEQTETAKVLPELPEGVVPVTWEVSREHLMIETDEARALYERIRAEDYPSMEELKADPVVAQLDALAGYYKVLYGNTAEIDTPERDQLRQETVQWFLTLGSARTESIDQNGRHHYVYDGPLQKGYQMELVLGLPASGKSTKVADPDSEAMGAFILDPDVIKAELPEYKESHGAGADAVHFEGMQLFGQAIEAFLSGDMKGTNVILPIVGTDLEELMNEYIKPFEDAGYNVKARFVPALENEAAARVVMRELGGGQLINSAVAFNFGEGPEKVYNELAGMINAQGEPYGYEEEELVPAA